MSLWALANIINYSMLRNHPIYSTIFYEYEQTPNPVKKIMARNSLEQIKKEKPLYKAELFLDSDYVLAGIIAGRELEIFINDLCSEARIKLVTQKGYGKPKRLPFSERLEKLEEKKSISKKDIDNLNGWWDIRCDLLHKEVISRSKSEIENMIEGLSRVIENIHYQR